MFKNKVLISLFSALVFVFPLIYQPYHDVVHHGEYHKHHDGISTTAEKCLVYEYQFASFDVPEQLSVQIQEIEIHSTQNTFYNSITFSEKVFHSASRAPPTIS